MRFFEFSLDIHVVIALVQRFMILLLILFHFLSKIFAIFNSASFSEARKKNHSKIFLFFFAEMIERWVCERVREDFSSRSYDRFFSFSSLSRDHVCEEEKTWKKVVKCIKKQNSWWRQEKKLLAHVRDFFWLRNAHKIHHVDYFWVWGKHL